MLVVLSGLITAWRHLNPLSSLWTTPYGYALILELGDDVVIGSDVHLSAHTVEAGMLTTAPVRLGRGVTVGVGSVVEIGATIGDGAQVGALSVVPKHARLAPGGIYVGAPARRLPRPLQPPFRVVRAQEDEADREPEAGPQPLVRLQRVEQRHTEEQQEDDDVRA
jgi:carbonic anhydrase/acetyltransferase-like protein (isoleucine patch superfamily)